MLDALSTPVANVTGSIISTPVTYVPGSLLFNTLFLLFLLIGCQRPTPNPVPVIPSQTITPLEKAGLHQVFQITPTLYSGNSPEDDEGFASLKAMGIQTIISVDGAKPDTARAEKYGLRYVHIPFGYDGIPRDRILQLVKARENLPGPIYVHCHHGKHRGPTAITAIQLCTDPSWDAQKASEWHKLVGTDVRYTGLLNLPKTLVKPTAEELANLPNEFPSVAMVPDFARLMVEVDHRWDHLKIVKASSWSVPKEHPDIDPPHEALQLVEHYRETARVPSAIARGPKFLKLLEDAETNALELEKELRAKPVSKERLDTAFKKVGNDCTSCHTHHRDKPR